MNRLGAAWRVATIGLVFSLAGCPGPATPPSGDAGGDAGPTIDVGPAIDTGARDGGVDGGPVDPCAGLTLCTTAGTTCETDTLVVCAANADGCLVRTATDCAASAGGRCDATAATPVCALPPDPCAAIPAAERCATAGTSCTGGDLVTCAENAFGCLVTTTTACDERAGGTCDATGTAACTFTGDPCAGVSECAAAGASCMGPELVTCALDGFGCLVETRTDCTSTMFGFCDAAGATPACSTAAVDPCMGMTLCTPEGRACDGDTLRVCATNAFGCSVETTTDCSAASGVCGSTGGMAVCGAACDFVSVCPAAAYCDGDDEVTCAADADSCLVETARRTCPLGCSAGACLDACPGMAALVLDCASGTVTGNTNPGADAIDEYACTDPGDYVGNEEVHGFRAAVDSIVTITATRGAGTRDYDLFVLDAGDGSVACGAGLPCAALSDSTGGNETTSFLARAGQLYYVVYDLFGTTPETTDYTLGITCATPAANASCATATAVGATRTITGESTTGGGPRPQGTGCGTSSGNSALYYSVTIPPSTEVAVATTPGFDVVLLTQDACGASSCLSRTDTSPESATLANTTASPITRIVAVHNYYSDESGTFDIAFSYRTLAANAACSTAAPLSATAMGDLALGGPRPTATGCGGGVGPALYYAVTIPAQSVADVTVTPTGATSWDPVVGAVASCTASACVGSVDDGAGGDPEVLSLENRGATPATVVVGVWSYGATTLGTFDVGVATAPLPWTSIPAACIDTGAGTLVAGVTTDDSASAITALPWPFDFFGTSVSHYSVTSNGFAQLWTSAVGTPSTAYTNDPIPGTFDPDGFVAPFWDDLRPNAGALARTLVSGTAGSRTFVIEWRDWRASGTGTESLTFQVHFLEATGAVEYHYCAMTAGASGTVHTGSGATIGAEDGAGAGGIQISYDMTGAVATGSGFRLTP